MTPTSCPPPHTGSFCANPRPPNKPAADNITRGSSASIIPCIPNPWVLFILTLPLRPAWHLLFQSATAFVFNHAGVTAIRARSKDPVDPSYPGHLVRDLQAHRHCAKAGPLIPFASKRSQTQD